MAADRSIDVVLRFRDEMTPGLRRAGQEASRFGSQTAQGAARATSAINRESGRWANTTRAAGQRAGRAGGDAINQGLIARVRAGAGSLRSAIETPLKGMGIGLLSVGAVAGAALIKGFQRLNAIDQAKAKLIGLGNSAKDVEAIMKNALNSVRGTAFGMDEAATTAAGAVAAGVKPGRDLERTLKLVADTATIAGTDMASMGSIFNSVATSNAIQGDTIAQLSDRGIPVVQMLAKQLGVTSEQVVKLASDGKIGFADFQDAMEKGLGGAAQSSGKTFQGAMKNLQASLARIGANLLSGAFPKLQGYATSITKSLSGVEDQAKKLGAALGSLVSGGVSVLGTAFTAAKAVIVPTAAAVGVLAKGFSALPGPIQTVVGALTAAAIANRLFGDRLRTGTGNMTAFVGGLRDLTRMQGAVVTTAQGASMQMGRFGSAIASIGQNVPTIARMQSAFVNAAAGAERFPRAAGAAAASMSLMRSAGSGLMNALGGPWGIALAVGVSALMLWKKRQQEAAQAAAESRQRVDELTGTLDKNTAATTSNTRSTVADQLQKQGAIDLAKRFHLSLSDVTDAAMGNQAAQDKLNGILNDYIIVAGYSTGVDKDRSAEASKLKGIINGSNGEVQKAVTAAKDHAQAMKTSADAARDAASKSGTYGKNMADLKTKTAATTEAHKRLKEAIENVKNTFLGGIDAEVEWKQALADATQAAKDNGKTLDTNSQKGRDNTRALQGVARAALGQVQQWQDANLTAAQMADKMPGLRKQLYDTAAQFGKTGKAADDWVNGTLANIPSTITSTVKVETDEAKAKVKTLGYDFDTLPKEVQSKILLGGAANAEKALNEVGLAARNVPGAVDVVTSVPTAMASAALLSQLQNVAVNVGNTKVNVTTAAPQALATEALLNRVSGAALSADAKTVTIPVKDLNAAQVTSILNSVQGAAMSADKQSVTIPTAAPGAINATSQIDGASAAAFRVDGQKATITIETVRREIMERSFRGYTFEATARATGGPIYGPGTGTSDSIPAWLSNGEHVLTAAEVERAGGQGAIYRMRAAIRAGALKFADGGAVQRFATGGAASWSPDMSGIFALISNLTYDNEKSAWDKMNEVKAAIDKSKRDVEAARRKLAEDQRKKGVKASTILADQNRINDLLQKQLTTQRQLTAAQSEYNRIKTARSLSAAQQFSSSAGTRAAVNKKFVSDLTTIEKRGFPALAHSLAEQGDDEAARVAASFASSPIGTLRSAQKALTDSSAAKASLDALLTRTTPGNAAANRQQQLEANANALALRAANGQFANQSAVNVNAIVDTNAIVNGLAKQIRVQVLPGQTVVQLDSSTIATATTQHQATQASYGTTAPGVNL